MTTALRGKEDVETDWVSLMRQYKQTESLSLRNELVMHYSYIARTVACQMRGIFNSYAQQEDIVNQGVLTLIDCVERFDLQKGIKFETYAYMRVRGGVIDFVRKQDWLPRRVRMTARGITAAHDELCGTLLREPTHKEVARHMGISEDVLAKNYGEIANSVIFSFEELLQTAGQSGSLAERSTGEDTLPESSLSRGELRQVLRDAIEALSERERLVISLYYYENLRLSDIASVLQVTEQRISQINSRAVAKLREPLEKYMKG